MHANEKNADDNFNFLVGTPITLFFIKAEILSLKCIETYYISVLTLTHLNVSKF